MTKEKISDPTDPLIPPLSPYRCPWTISAGIGDAYDPEEALHVVKMMAGTEDMFVAAVGLVKAVFAARGVDSKFWQMIILRVAKVPNAPCQWQAKVWHEVGVELYRANK